MRKITANGLSAKSLRDAAKQIDKLQAKYVTNNRNYVRELTKAGMDEARNHLVGLGDSDPPDFATETPYVRMGFRDGLMTSTIRLEGEDVAFVEFGAGIHYNGNPNGSPNKYGVKLGYTIGSYGQHQGLQEEWQYYEDGEWHKSQGTEATMPLFHATEAIRQRYIDIAKTVFGR